jgi:putative zinc finger/helix-turn-helix YgiT family protein
MSELPEVERCCICGGEARLTREVRPITILARSVAVEDVFYRCSQCGEEVYRPGMMEAVMRLATAKIREEDGLLAPDQVRGIRRKYGLTQPEFERLLGVGANTVVRWERGTVPQGSAADSLLRLLDQFPDNARFLATLHGVELAEGERKARTKAA